MIREAFLEGRGVPVIDMHGHLGPFYGIYMPEAALDDMVRGMDRCGVEQIVLSPHFALSGDCREGNAEMLDAVRRYPGRVFGYCTANPNYADSADAELDRYLDVPGVVGIKVHPSMHDVPLDDARYAGILERADREKRLLLSHTWGASGGCGTREVRAVAERYPNLRFLLGHSCYGAWAGAIAIAAQFPNVYLELTAAAHVYGLVEWMCRDAGSHKVVYGTDYPWFDPMFYIGCVVFARISDDDMANILYRNGRRLLDEQTAHR